MKVLHTIRDTRAAIPTSRTVGLVPTMGALHEGHLSLIRRARHECDYVVISIFVNPTQFGPGEDFDAYPRTLVEDAEKCRMADVDLIFAPSKTEMYPPPSDRSDRPANPLQGGGMAQLGCACSDSWVEVKGYLTQTLEGEFRPNHFRGVTTVCAKLFNITRPTYAYFGMKDYQQLRVIQKMVADLKMPLEIVPCETMREPDGLAMSSRNAYLSPDERRAALVLSRSLAAARAAYESGERDAHAVQLCAENLIKTEPLARPDYVAVRDAVTLAPIDHLDRPTVLLLAVRIGTTRLIDNALLSG